MNIRTKVTLWMALLIVGAFVLGGIVTYSFIPGENLTMPPPGAGPPPWSPKIGGPGQKESPDKPESPEAREAEAEKAKRDQERRKRFVERWRKKLDLDDEQVEQFHQIFTAGHERFVAVERASREEFSRIRRETDARIIEVLNQEQAKEYQEIVEEYRLRRKAREAEEEEKSRGRKDKD